MVASSSGLAPHAAGLTAPASGARHEATSMFTLYTDVYGLYPNASVTAAVRVDNPQSRLLRVLSATATIGDASAACPASNLSAQSFAGVIAVGPRSEGIVPIAVHMAATAPDACQRATFPLTLHATGELVEVQPTRRPRGIPFTGAANAVLVITVGLAMMLIGMTVRLAARPLRSFRSRP